MKPRRTRSRTKLATGSREQAIIGKGTCSRNLKFDSNPGYRGRKKAAKLIF